MSAHCLLSSTYAGTETTRIAVIYANRHVRSAEYRLPTKQNFVYLGTDRPLVEKQLCCAMFNVRLLQMNRKALKELGLDINIIPH